MSFSTSFLFARWLIECKAQAGSNLSVVYWQTHLPGFMLQKTITGMQTSLGHQNMAAGCGHNKAVKC